MAKAKEAEAPEPAEQPDPAHERDVDVAPEPTDVDHDDAMSELLDELAPDVDVDEDLKDDDDDEKPADGETPTPDKPPSEKTPAPEAVDRVTALENSMRDQQLEWERERQGLRRDLHDLRERKRKERTDDAAATADEDEPASDEDPLIEQSWEDDGKVGIRRSAIDEQIGRYLKDHPDRAPGILEEGLLLKLRFELDQYVNLRPVKLYPNVPCPLAGKGPEDIDFVVIRENTEGLYSGMGGVQYKGTPHEVATQIMCNTRMGVERAIRYAFELCRRRDDKKRLTLVAKTNVLTSAHDLWWRAFNEVGQEYPDIDKDYNHVDACCMWFVKNPEYYDTIVVCNMFGDIITDLGAMIQGGMGVAAGGNINPAGVSMFEPIGGSAPKYTGQKKINPIAAIAALAMLLRESGANSGDEKLRQAGERVENAIMATTPKMQSMSAGRMGFSTGEVGDLVVEAVAKGD